MPEGGAAQIVAGSISGLSFQYYDAGGNRTAASSEVRKIGISISGTSLLRTPDRQGIWRAAQQRDTDIRLTHYYDKPCNYRQRKFKSILPEKTESRGLYEENRRVFATVFLIAFVSVSYAQQSLADLAKQEKERREEIKNSRVITDEEAAKYKRDAQASQPFRSSHRELHILTNGGVKQQTDLKPTIPRQMNPRILRAAGKLLAQNNG